MVNGLYNIFFINSLTFTFKGKERKDIFCYDTMFKQIQTNIKLNSY